MLIRFIHPVFALGALVVWLASPHAVLAADRTVLVLPFENQTGDATVDWLGEGVANLTIDRLVSEKGIYTFAREERLAVYRKAGIPGNVVVSRATAIRMGWEAGADVVVVGTLSGTPVDFGVQARLIDLAALNHVEEVSASGKLDEVLTLAGALSGKIAGKLSPGAPAAVPLPKRLPPPSAFEKYVRGLLAEEPARRIAFLKDAVRLDPGYSDAVYELGLAYHEAHDFRSSREWFDKVGVSSPHYLTARFLQGLNAFRVGDYEAAAEIFANLAPSAASLTNLGAALSRKGDGAAAIPAWRRAADLDPLTSDVWFNLGYGSLAESDTAGAIRSFEQGLKMKGRDAETLFLLARAYERGGRAEEAQRLTGEAIRLSPRVERWSGHLPTGVERLAVAPPPPTSRLAQDSTGAPLWSASRLERRAAGQNLPLWLQSVNKFIAAESLGEAIRQLREIVTVFPASAEPHEMLARIYEQQHEEALALGELDAAAGLDPSPTSLLALARAYRKANQAARALDAVEQVLKIEPGHPAASAMKKELDQVNVPRPSRRRP